MSIFFTDPAPALVPHRAGSGTADSAIGGLLAALAEDVELLASLAPAELGLSQRATSGDPETPRPPRTAAEAEDLALTVRQMLNLGDRAPVQDVVAHCASLGLLAFAFDLGANSADGGTILLRRGGVSVVNSQLQVGRRRLTAAHELGLYLAADKDTVDWRLAEHGADVEAQRGRFARSFLLPEAGLRAEWSRHRVDPALRETAVQLGSAFGVDMATLARRTQELGLVTADEAAALRAVTTRRADIVDLGLIAPVDLQEISLPLPFQRAVLRALHDEAISRERALQLLRDTFADHDLPPGRVRREDEFWSFVS